MKKLSDLLVEMMKEDDLWNDLHSIIHNYTDEHVTKFIDALARIRNIDSKTDADIVDDSIRTLGFDIHQDILEANGDNIRSGFYQMSQFYQINGCYMYPKFIEFILGFGFRMQNLYTVDYVNFYDRPLGTMIEDGGSWFATSHVDLMVYDGPSEAMFALNIGEGDIAYIKKANGYAGMSTLERFEFDAALEDCIGRTLDRLADDQRIVRALFRKRISDTFYRFAPIQEVIRNIYMARFAAADLFISGSAVFREKTYIAQPPSIKSIELIIPEKVSANEALGSLKGLVTWYNDAQSTVDMSDVTDSANLLGDASVMRFNDPELGLMQTTTVTAKYIDFTESKSVTVFMSGVELVPDSVELRVSTTLFGNTRVPISLFGMFGDTVSLINSNSVDYYFDSADIEIAGGFLTVKEVLFESEFIITASYIASDESVHTSFVSVKLLPALLNTIAASIKQRLFHVEGDTLTETLTVVQGQKYAVKAEALYTDNTVSEVNAMFESMTEFVQLDEANMFVAQEAVAEYPFSLRASIVEDERITSSVEFYRASAVVNLLQSITIAGPNILAENTTQVYQAIGNWSNGVSTFLSNVDWSSTFGTDADGTISEIAITRDGIVTSQRVDADTRYMIRARMQREGDGAMIEGAAVITVIKTKRTLNSIVIYCADSIQEGYTAPLQFFGNWNNGTRTQIMPDVINIVDRKTGALVSAASVENGQVLYHNTTQLKLQDGDYKFKDSETGVEYSTIEVEHELGSNGLSGVFDILIEYTYDGEVVGSNRPLVATPKVKKVISIAHKIPETLDENARYFFRVSATYDNGNTEDVRASWKVYDSDGSDDINDIPVDIISNSFSLVDIVSSLTGLYQDDLYAMSLSGEELSPVAITRLLRGEYLFTLLENKPSAAQTWPQKLSIMFAEYENTRLVRSVFQTRNALGEDEPFTLDCTVGSFDLRTNHVVVDAPAEPTNTILSWYIKGPVELAADPDLMYSYSLVVDFDDLGEEYAVSNDWEIELYSGPDRDERREIVRYMVEQLGNVELLPMSTDGSSTRIPVDDLTEEELLDILPTSNVIDIDQNGYVYPKLNLGFHAVVKALYNDGLSTFEETLDIYTKPVNRNLLGLDMLLVSPTENRTYDFGNLITDEASEWSELYQNTYRYQLAVELRKADEPDPVAPTSVVVWRAEPVGRGISFDQASGRLYIAPQTEDSEVTLIATYAEEFRETEDSAKTVREEVESRYVVRVYAHRALDSITLSGPDYTLDNTVFYPNVRIKRRDGTLVDKMNVLTWEIVEADPSITRNGDFGFNIPSMTTDSVLTLRAIAKEGLNVLTKDLQFNVLAGFVPDHLLMQYNDVGHKDNSVIQLKALLKLRNNPIPVDVTRDCFWLMGTDNVEASVGNRTGILELGYAVKPYNAVIRCIYNRDNFREETSINMEVQSSYPIYWTDKQLPINTAYFTSILDEKKYTILPSIVGGRVLTLTDSDEYTYFACPVEMGTAKFSLVPSQVKIDDWGNMNAPVNVVRTYINNDVQDWAIYRSVKRGIGHIELSVVYSQ